MPLTDVYFVFIFLFLALLFSIGCFTSTFKGVWWLSIVASIFWFLIGIFSITRAPVFYYQRELTILWFGIGFVVMFAPVWYGRGKKEEQDFDNASKKEITSSRKWWGEVDEKVKKSKSGGR